MNLIICGLSKNCLKTTRKNIDSLIHLNNNSSNFNIQIIIVDSDSNDGTKDFLQEISNNYKFITVINEDGLEKIYDSRIQRISHCRNLGLNVIKNEKFYQSFIYIPMDFDIDQFEITSPKEFVYLAKRFEQDNDIDAMFPVSHPFYYDIFALRAVGWVTINSQLISNKLKKYLRLGSFIWNYIFIFRKQWSPEKIKNTKLKIISAFGGSGMYKLDMIKLENIKYSFSQKDTDFISEHIFFNKYFDNLKIKSNWILPAPPEHLLYKTQNINGKINYFFKTVKFDLKNIFNFSK